MAHPDPGVLAWASAVLGSEVTVVRSLRLGGTPWLLRVIAAEQAGETETEVAAMTHIARAAKAGLPVPEVLGYDLAEQTGYALALTGLVHGDLWYGSTLWDDEGRLTAIIDWDCAGVGPAGIDLGALRIDAALYHGLPAADDILRGWEAEAGRPGCHVPYWDVVAALSSPPDMGWFPDSMAAQGRPDLTRAVMLERRDAFLAAALSQLEAVS
jgi:aminoglycoside phosphotransferase (APT) family kinase protein